MIIDKVIKIKVAKYNIKHYSQFFNVNLKDIIEIDVEKYLQKSSNIKINVQCDICNTQRYIKYQAYSKNIKSCEKYPIYTCDKCSHLKIKEFNKEKYGVEYYSQTSEFTEKFKSTMLDRYGVEYALQSKDIREKVSKTNLKKFGYINPFMDKNRIKIIFKEKYGVLHPSSVIEFRNRAEETMMERYGVKYTLQNKELNDRVNRKTIIRNDNLYIRYIGDNISLFNCNKKHEFEINSDLYHSRVKGNIPLCTICYPIGDQKSIKEKELLEFIKDNYSGDIISGYRDGLEIDIYLPELKIGFEFNGLYWHSEKYKDRDYHLNKTNYFKERGIRIIHIWEDDWSFRKDILESQILNSLGKSKKIWARKCEIKLVDVKDCVIFLDDNHIQGGDISIVKLGLYFKDKLVSVMTFDQFDGSNKMEDGGHNLSRFCNKINTNIIGGASKLLSHFLNLYNPSRIISYVDKDWSVGQLYYKLGFKNINESRPDYKYIVDNKRVHKSRYRKSKTNISESKLGIPKIWDCGKIKFEYKKTP